MNFLNHSMFIGTWNWIWRHFLHFKMAFLSSVQSPEEKSGSYNKKYILQNKFFYYYEVICSQKINSNVIIFFSFGKIYNNCPIS